MILIVAISMQIAGGASSIKMLKTARSTHTTPLSVPITSRREWRVTITEESTGMQVMIFKKQVRERDVQSSTVTIRRSTGKSSG